MLYLTIVIFVLGNFFFRKYKYLKYFKWIGVVYLLYLAYDIYISAPKEFSSKILSSKSYVLFF